MIFKCLENGDLDISGGKLILTDGQQEVLQLIRNNFRMLEGEEPLNTALGVPYFRKIFEKSTPQETIESILFEVVKETAGVLAVLDFRLEIDPTTRHASVTFTVQTVDGPVTTTQGFP